MKLPAYFGKLKKPKIIIVRRVAGNSMLPTLGPGQIIVATSLYRTLRSGHMVVVGHNDLEKIKRVRLIRDHMIFLLGDNATASTDSREFGWLHRSCIVAKVVWPRSPNRVCSDPSQESLKP